jgi:hypothetical protein
MAIIKHFNQLFLIHGQTYSWFQTECQVLVNSKYLHSLKVAFKNRCLPFWKECTEIDYILRKQ